MHLKLADWKNTIQHVNFLNLPLSMLCCKLEPALHDSISLKLRCVLVTGKTQSKTCQFLRFASFNVVLLPCPTDISLQLGALCLAGGLSWQLQVGNCWMLLGWTAGRDQMAVVKTVLGSHFGWDW